jgi:hypothetical protein
LSLSQSSCPFQVTIPLRTGELERKPVNRSNFSWQESLEGGDALVS